jgi:predicted kinase
MLIIFSGLPGAGKSTLAKALAGKMSATYLRVDSIEQAVKDSMLHTDNAMDSGYLACYALAKENLLLGNNVVADSVNSIALTRNAWRQIAQDVKSDYYDIEIICSDKNEHQKRVETRKSDINNHRLPSWKEVSERSYEQWDMPRTVIDTAGKTVGESVKEILETLL